MVIDRKRPLKSFVIAITGDFGIHRSFEKMRQWIQVNGGTFSYDINPQVTHLVSSKEHFKKNRGLVKAALANQAIKIVSFDWLEDSLIAMHPRKEREYLMGVKARVQKEGKKKKMMIRQENIKKGMEAFEKTCKEFENDMNSSNYHIYHDDTTYKYDVTLARADLLTNKNERHVLKLYESHETPKLYACFQKYSAPGEVSSANILAPIGSSFDVAFDHFKKFFLLKTGIEWDERLTETAPSAENFVYVRPRNGQPKGTQLNGGLEKHGVDDSMQPAADSLVNEVMSSAAVVRKPKPFSMSFFDLCATP